MFAICADTDGDGLADMVETNTGDYVSPTDTGTDPADPDSDDDGLSDGDEVNGTFGYVTDPTDRDTDGDGYGDGNEISAGTDPTDPDQSPERVTGDIDGDGETNAIDTQKTINQILGIERSSYDIVADLDDDGRVNAVDLQTVIIAVLGV